MTDGYVRLKHTLAELALAAITRPGAGRTAAALLAYAGMSRSGEPVLPEALAGTVQVPSTRQMSPAGLRRALLRTGLFTTATTSDDATTISLAAPFQPHAAYFYRQVARLGEALRLLHGSRPHSVSGRIWRSAAMFNAGLFFECHEYLEDAWRAAAEPERTFYHGLVQAAAGCYHVEKGNTHGARTLVGKAIAKLQPFAPMHRGVDVSALLAGLDDLLRALATVPPRLPADRGDLPLMQFTSVSSGVSR